MEIPQFSLIVLQGFLICLVRVGSMIATIPIFSGGQVPAQLRIAIAFIFSLLIFPAVQENLPHVTYEPVSLLLLVGGELLLGTMVGFMAQLVFMAAEFGGSIIGYQMGFAAANVFDPANQRQVALISQFQSVFAILLFLVLNVHHLFFEAIVASFQMLPPGKLNLGGGAIMMIMEIANHSLILGLRLGAPILALLILSNLTLGVMSRVFPQLNAFLLSFPLNIGISFVLIGLTFEMVASLLQQEFSLLADRFLQLFSLL